MKKFLKVDLRIARRASGLHGTDLAQLLGCSKDRVSRLENGKARLCVKEILTLSMLYDKPFSSIFPLTSTHLVDRLRERLSEIEFNSGDQKRLEFLNDLTDRVRSLSQRNHEA